MVESLRDRLIAGFNDRNWRGKSQWLLDITVQEFRTHTKGAVVDAVIGTGAYYMTTSAVLKDADGKTVCTVKVSTNTPTGAVIGGIYKASNSVTLAISEAIFNALDDDILAPVN